MSKNARRLGGRGSPLSRIRARKRKKTAKILEQLEEQGWEENDCDKTYETTADD